MTSYDLNRLWLTIASEESLKALRQTDPDRTPDLLPAVSDFSAPVSHRTNARADIAEAA